MITQNFLVIGQKERRFEKRESDEKQRRFDLLFDIGERREKQKRKKYYFQKDKNILDKTTL